MRCNFAYKLKEKRTIFSQSLDKLMTTESGERDYARD